MSGWSKTLSPIAADCAWDFFSCTERAGSWPANRDCCELRFGQCTDHVAARRTAAAAAAAAVGPARSGSQALPNKESRLHQQDTKLFTSEFWVEGR